MELNIKIDIKISFPMLGTFTEGSTDKLFLEENASLDDKTKEKVRANMNGISDYLTPKVKTCFMEGAEAQLSGKSSSHNPYTNVTYKKYWQKGFDASMIDTDEIKLAISRKTNRLINDITNLYKD